jgi:hypothetical protein
LDEEAAFVAAKEAARALLLKKLAMVLETNSLAWA